VKDTLEHRTGQIKFLERYIKEWDGSQKPGWSLGSNVIYDKGILLNKKINGTI
jgi:hypothetical protein